MLDALRFVQGAIPKKDLVPALVHFRIQNGSILGYNGSIALSSPLPLDLTCCPKASQFIKAVQACDETVQLHLTEKNRLAVRAGKFSAFVECLPVPKEYPDVKPEGTTVRLPGNLLNALEILEPFIAKDASRAWARGILFRGCSAFATNNIVIAERWLGAPFPTEVNIPEDAIREILRIGEEPESLQVSENNITFHFSGRRWLRAQQYTTQWPNVSPIFDRECNPVTVPDGFFEALDKLTPFVEDDRCYFLPDAVSTSSTPEVGATIQVPGLAVQGCYNVHQLLHLRGVLKKVDFTAYPNPCLFYGDLIRGAIVGMRG